MSNALAGGSAALDTFTLADSAALSVETLGMDILTKVPVTLEQQTALSLTGTEGDIYLIRADVADENAAGLSITTYDAPLSNGGSGNVYFSDYVNAGGRVVLNTVGSFTGTRDDSYLKLGEDTYRMGTGFTLGGDLGSEEHYLNVINTTDDSSRIVTLRIEKAEDIYIRGTEAYPLVYDYETIPYGADTEISVVTDLTPEKLAGTIVEAIDRYQGIADSSEAAEEEKEEAAARLATLTRLIARVMVKDSPDSAVFRGKLLLVLQKAVENSVLGEEEAAAAVESFDAWMELTFGEDETGTDQSQEDDGNGTGQSPDENESGTGTEQNPQAYVLSAEQLEEILTQVLSGGARAALIADHASGVFHTEDAQGYDSEDTEVYLELYRSLMEQDEIDRIMEALRETAEAEKPENVPMPPRPMEVVIGESTGTDGVHISNYGEITLIQERGNLHIGRIETNNPWLTPEADALSDVWVDSLEGSIIGTVRPDGKANISADHIFLHAGGSILDLLVDEVAHAYEVGTQIRTRKDGEEVVVPELTLALKEDGTPETDAEGNPVIISGAYADYTGTFTYDTNAATRVNATADRGDIEISEAAGHIGLGVLNAPNGKVRISAGPVVDEDGNAAVDELGNVISRGRPGCEDQLAEGSRQCEHHGRLRRIHNRRQDRYRC